MLVFSRGRGDSVALGVDRRVTVESIREDAARLRFAERFGRNRARVMSEAFVMRADDWRPFGDEIRVGVLVVTTDRVRVGVIAPKNVIVHRQEVFVEIHPTYPPWPEEDGS